MNREILFRGKRIDDGEWVEGYLVEKTDFDSGEVCQSYIVEKVEFGRNADDDTRFCDIDEIEVSPETVGQFTGLTDKNGKKIFEGDIITLYDENNKPIGNYSIEFYKYAYCYVQNICGTKCYDLLKVEQRDESGEIFATYSYGIIGNIYDNPELLTDKT